MNGNTEDEIPIYKYSVHRDYTAEGIRLSVHVRGNDLQQTADDMQAFYDKCEEKVIADNQKLAPFKEPKKSKDQEMAEKVVGEANQNSG